jgi:hypothetical protein
VDPPRAGGKCWSSWPGSQLFARHVGCQRIKSSSGLISRASSRVPIHCCREAPRHRYRIRLAQPIGSEYSSLLPPWDASATAALSTLEAFPAAWLILEPGAECFWRNARRSSAENFLACRSLVAVANSSREEFLQLEVQHADSIAAVYPLPSF